MRIHILGICGTFMGGLAMLARQLVSGMLLKYLQIGIAEIGK